MTMGRRPTMDLEPRLLTRAEAATYCKLSPSGFDEWISEGRLPKAIPDTHRWDRKAIDLALDKASGIEPESPSAYDRWKAGGHVRAT